MQMNLVWVWVHEWNSMRSVGLLDIDDSGLTQQKTEWRIAEKYWIKYVPKFQFGQNR